MFLKQWPPGDSWGCKKPPGCIEVCGKTSLGLELSSHFHSFYVTLNRGCPTTGFEDRCPAVIRCVREPTQLIQMAKLPPQHSFFRKKTPWLTITNFVRSCFGGHEIWSAPFRFFDWSLLISIFSLNHRILNGFSPVDYFHCLFVCFRFI